MKRKAMKGTTFAVVTVCLAAIVGCSSGGKPAESAGTEPAKPKEKVEINFWYSWRGAEGEAMEKVIADFNAGQDRIVVKGTLETDQKKQLTAITGGSPPDVANNFGYNSAAWGVQGAMTPLDPFMQKSGMKASDFVPAAIQQTQYKGTTYALPLAMHIRMLFYNKDILAQAGYDKPPETIQQLEDYYDKLNVVEPSGEIKRLAINPNLDIYHYAYMLGGGFYDFAKQEISPQSPGFIKALAFMNGLYQKVGGAEKLNAFYKTFGQSGKPDDPFFVGKYAMVSAGEWYGTMIKNAAPAGFRYGIAPMPYDAETPGKKGSAVVNASTLYIPKGAKHPDEAWEFLNWFMKPQNMAKFDAAIGNLPTTPKAMDEAVFKDVPGFKEFFEASKHANVVTFPSIPFTEQYQQAIVQATSEVFGGKSSPEVASKTIADKMKPLVEQYK
ncbi:ABC transporter substrate-binding protein [Paenibacillus hemerocallicola]|uniref:ABC transporter substrate-binding protein n=1 Tax=Paenibacillus hemerocallicola TaxID=1172614 RepID=A0A5C4SYR2_9BACL|nr:ABC transporter substrate-binding protein [Paenibacillus hemerocallicola]TNJ61944.1 ABC transporter substrate-binding protein [Paenibacillus hemerocallicola]